MEEIICPKFIVPHNTEYIPHSFQKDITDLNYLPVIAIKLKLPFFSYHLFLVKDLESYTTHPSMFTLKSTHKETYFTSSISRFLLLLKVYELCKCR